MMQRIIDIFRDKKTLIFVGVIILILFVLLGFGQYIFSIIKLAIARTNQTINPTVSISSAKLPASDIILADSISVCYNSFNKNMEYSASDIVRFDDGRLMVYQMSDPEESKVKVCKHYIIDTPNDEFSKNGKSHNISKYIPAHNLLIISTSSQSSAVGLNGFYNTETKTVMFPDLPKLDELIDPSHRYWRSSELYSMDSYEYFLFTPYFMNPGECFSEQDCKELEQSLKTILNTHSVYLYRSDGKLIKILENNNFPSYEIVFTRVLSNGNPIINLYGKGIFSNTESSLVLSKQVYELFDDPKPIDYSQMN